ncbi:alpha/beta hydrolase [Nonomuraea sp. NN258]|uniref:alpha/beta hydrolase n=1 Tax=Nonomuraea antri TaxID=2730852 RepID=UPI001567F863|nr:alpha/beta hydrolase [Nonomuraea antri]NRQ40255.1 alpha/beta hydrolase [Nonomuraea antri]
METTFVLVHSPSVGPATWEPVARALERRGHAAVVPDLTGVGVGGAPYWPRAVEAVRAAVRTDGPETPIVLAAHSNAGLFVPVIKEGLGDRVVACVFADAHLPPARGLVRPAEEEFLPFLRGLAGPDGVLPRWSDWWSPDDVAALLPDPGVRERVVAEQPRLPLDYYTQPVPVPVGWDEVRCSFLWYGPPYDEVAAAAAGRGWPVTRLPGRHLHQVLDPESVAGALLSLSRKS